MKKIYVLIWLLLFSNLLFATRFAIRYFNYDDGLPSDLIKKVTQDDRGFLWIASDGGLVRFDGIHFKTFTHSLPSPYVKDIFELSNNRLLVSTDKGIVKVLTESLNIKIKTFLSGSSTLTDSTVFYPKSIFKDRKENLWISEPYSVARVTKSNKFKRYSFPSYVESGSYLRSFFFFENESGELFVLSQTGHAFFYESQIDSFVRIPISNRPESWVVNNVLKVNARLALLGASDGVYLIKAFNKTGIRLKKLFQISDVQALSLSKSGRLWVGTTGLGLYYAQNWEKARKLTRFGKLKLKVINDIYNSPDDQLWVSSDNGLALIYQPVFEKVYDFSNYAVQNLFQSNENGLIATDGKKVYQLVGDPSHKKFKTIWQNPGKVISSMAHLGDTIVIGHLDGSVTLLKRNKVKHFRLPNNNMVFSMAPDQDAHLWIAQADFSALTKLNSRLEKKIYSAEQGIVSQPLVVKTFGHRLLVGATGDSTYLYTYEKESDTFKNISLPLDRAIKSTLEIYDLTFSPIDSSLYLASNVGILKIKQNRVKLIELEHSKIARSLVFDGQGNLWVGTQHGAYCLLDTLQLYFDDLAGFTNQTFAFRSAVMDKNGRVYFGTYDGIYAQQKVPFTVKATNIPQIVDLILNESNPVSPEQLAAGIDYQSTLRLTVSALNFPAHKIVYQWRLPGRKNKWTNQQANPEILLSNLQAGSYQLQIRARQIGYTWSPILSIPILVKNPWYFSKWFWLLIISTFILLIVISTQLIKEKKTRMQIASDLEISEFQLNAIVSNTPVILFMIDNEGKITFAQGKGLKGLKKQENQLIGEKLSELMEDKLEGQNDCNKVLSGHSFESVHQLGSKFYRFWFSPRKDTRGNIIGALGIAIDITELKETETRLRRAIIQAEASNKAKSEFIANMSHEIRTPLNAIIGLTDLMDQNNLTDQQKEFLQTVRFSARELLKIINQILDFSKIESGKLVLEIIPFDLKTLINNIANAFNVMAQQKGIRFNLNWDENNPQFVKGDPTRLGQVLINLLGNAIKFTEKGQVTLLVKKQSESKDDVDFMFVVQDTGIGIPRDKMDKIFGSFEQVDSSLTRKYGGTGLGLTITSRLIEMMGSKIKVESQENVGTRFYFELTFPKVKDQKVEELPDFSIFLTHEKPKVAADLIQEKEPEAAQTSDGHTILLVEDNVINQRVAKRMVENMGYKVEIANNGQEALDKLAQKKYDLILMDVQMPVMDGLRAAQKIRVNEINSDEHIPIIAMTAHAQKEDRDRCLEAGMDDYLSKPINMKILEEKIKQYLEKK